jgi:hypothetical protein
VALRPLQGGKLCVPCGATPSFRLAPLCPDASNGYQLAGAPSQAYCQQLLLPGARGDHIQHGACILICLIYMPCYASRRCFAVAMDHMTSHAHHAASVEASLACVIERCVMLCLCL